MTGSQCSLHCTMESCASLNHLVPETRISLWLNSSFPLARHIRSGKVLFVPVWVLSNIIPRNLALTKDPLNRVWKALGLIISAMQICSETHVQDLFPVVCLYWLVDAFAFQFSCIFLKGLSEGVGRHNATNKSVPKKPTKSSLNLYSSVQQSVRSWRSWLTG